MMIYYEHELYKALSTSKKQVDNIIQNISQYYGKLEIPKLDPIGTVKTDNNGNVICRIIHPPKPALKSLQKRINSRLLSRIDLPDYLHGCVKGKSNVTNALAHKGNHYFFQTDLKSYFPSITPKIVNQVFLKYGFSYKVANILTRLTTFDFQLPQGSSCSPIIANLAFLEYDDAIYKICKENNFTYTRQVDDITISSSKPIKKKTVDDVLEVIRQSPYKYHHRKTELKSGDIDITGVNISNNESRATQSHLFKLGLLDFDSGSALGLINYFKQFTSIES